MGAMNCIAKKQTSPAVRSGGQVLTQEPKYGGGKGEK